MTRSQELRVGVVGLGVIGKKHLAAYEEAARAGWPCRVVAVCDHKADLLHDVPGREAFADVKSLLRGARLDLLSVCTRTDSHVEIAEAALGAGTSVLVEKPVALSARAVERLAASARQLSERCIPAHCMRFWPGWDTLKDAVRDRTWGHVLSASFQRLSSPPGWSPEFYGDPDKSGGALVDLHIHDADFIRWCFGDPLEVVSTGSLDHVTTLYRYAHPGPGNVVAEGGWNFSPGFGFRMRYLVAFERATLDFDFGRDPELLIHRDGLTEPFPIGELSAYDVQARHALDLVLGRVTTPVVTIDDALGVARLLDAERESLTTRKPVRLA